MSFSDTVFIFFLALIVFGPKKLPEMARQAGRLLAELRRASNEFRSQIETEIAHLEVQKKQTETAPIPASQTTVASLSVNPAAGETIPHTAQPSATLASSAEEGNSTSVDPAAASLSNSSSGPAAEPVAQPSDSTSQASHV
jgi:sec-independent protein translocase protein TatB